MSLGVVQKKNTNITLTTNFIKQAYEVPLTDDEQKLETAFLDSQS